MSSTIRRELKFPQPREQVWSALANSAALAEWMFPNDFEPRIGHRFTFHMPPNPQARFDGLTVHCEVIKCTPHSELAFTWVVGDFLNTVVSYRLEPDGAGTRVLFEHSGFEQEEAFKGAQYGWAMMHGKLAQVVTAEATNP